MKARRFDIYHVTLADITALRAYHKGTSNAPDKIEFSYNDSLLFKTVRKRNTQLFDVLSDIRNSQYTVEDDDVIETFLYDAIIVELRMPPGEKTSHALTLSTDPASVSRKPVADLPKFLYDNGFTITGVPSALLASEPGENRLSTSTGNVENVEYVPFISSASMSRKSEYLFVRKTIAAALMKRLSVDMLSMDQVTGRPYVTDKLKKADKPYLSAAKLAAYLGNALSDGSSVKEMRTAFTATHPDAEAPDVTLDEKTVICVEDFDHFVHAEHFASHVWKMHQIESPVMPLRGSYCKKPQLVNTEEKLLKFFWHLSQAKTQAKPRALFADDECRQQWKNAIQAISFSTLRGWCDSGKRPICLPSNSTSYITQHKDFYSFAIACALYDPNMNMSCDESAFEDLKTSIADHVVSKQITLQQVLDLASIGAILKKKANNQFLEIKFVPNNNNITITLTTSSDLSRLNNLQSIELDEPAGEDTPVYKLCKLFSYFSGGSKEAYFDFLRDNKDDLKDAWLRALREINVYPQHLHETRLPVSDNMSNLHTSIHGYAFLYALTIFLKQKDAVNGQHCYDIKPTQQDYDALCRELESVVEKFFASQSFNKNKDANGLWNSVTGKVDPNEAEKPELITIANLDQVDDDKDEITHRVCFTLTKNTTTPFMAQLTEPMPAALKELLTRIANGYDTKENNTSIDENEKQKLLAKLEAWITEHQTDLQQEAIWFGKHAGKGAWQQRLQTCLEALKQCGVTWDVPSSIRNIDNEGSTVISSAHKFRNYIRQHKDDYYENTNALYDGCGFADNEVFDALEKLMLVTKELPEKGRRFDALIIRLPFIKGLLIRLDWKKILLKKIEENEAANLKIKDIFDERRSLDSARVLLTASMMKGYKQLKNLADETMQDHGNDPWRYYWDTIKRNNISLLIAGRNSPPRQSTRLNYQFLATNVMDTSTLDTLVKAVLDKAVLLYNDPVSFVKEFEATSDDASTDSERVFQPVVPSPIIDVSNVTDKVLEDLSTNLDDPDDQRDDDDEIELVPSDNKCTDVTAPTPSIPLSPVNETRTQAYLLKATEKFSTTRYMKNAMDSRMRSLVLRMMRGQIPSIRGDVRFLVPDLDAMLTHISNLIVRPNEKAYKLKVTSLINQKTDKGLGYYFAPCPAEHSETWYSLDENKKPTGHDVVVLRNPHLSVGEDALLVPLSGKDLEYYQEHYGELHGVVMIPSLALSTINGADSDGDRASIVSEESVVAAVKQACERANSVLQNVIEQKTKLLAMLNQEFDKLQQQQAGDTYAAFLPLYIKSLMTLVESMPDQAMILNKGIAPPLIYAGSNAGGAFLKPQDLKAGTLTLSTAFWKAYSLTTEQAIGIMSLNALDAASEAYLYQVSQEAREACVCLPPLDANRQQLLDLLRHWRVTNGALTTALEIDMAKTNIRPGHFVLQQYLKKTDADFFGKDYASRGFSRFRDYRNAYVKHCISFNQLDRSDFNREMGKLLKRLEPEKLAEKYHPLDRLPWIVWEKWEEVQTTLPAAQKTYAFTTLFEAPACDKKHDKVKEKMQDILIRYGETIAARKQFELRRTLLNTSYNALLRYLMHRNTLLDAMTKANTLLPAGGADKEQFNCDATQHLTDQLNTLDKSLRQEQTLAGFVWESDKTNRSDQYKKLKVDLTDDSPFLANAEDIYLFKQYIKYLLQQAKIVDGTLTRANGIHTPAALRNKLLGASMQKQAELKDLQGILAGVCLDLIKKNGWVTTASNQRVHVMSEFLMIHLLGEYLSEILKPETDEKKPTRKKQMRKKQMRKTSKSQRMRRK